METGTTYSTLTKAGPVPVRIVDRQRGFRGAPPRPQRESGAAGLLSELGFGRLTQLGLMAVDVTIWTWVTGLQISFVS
jgi:hypothetical protein